MYNNRIYSNGQRFTTPDQPCHICTCQVTIYTNTTYDCSPSQPCETASPLRSMALWSVREDRVPLSTVPTHTRHQGSAAKSVQVLKLRDGLQIS